MAARVVDRTLVVVCASLALSACGGGGGGGGGSGGGGGQFSVSPSSLTFQATSTGGSSIGPLKITGTISGASPQTLYINAQVTGNAVANVSDITITSATTGTANVYPISQHVVGPGSFSSVITITACTTSVACNSGVIGSAQTVNVTYTVDGVRSSAANLTYQLGDTPVPGDLVRTFDVTGYPAQNWTAQSTVPWLTVNPASGNASARTQVTATLDAAVLQSYESGTYTGEVTLIPSTGERVSVPVTLTISRTSVNFVAPYVALAATEQDVIIRGENLDRFPITGVRFGSSDAVSYTVVSKTEIRARHPALATGTHEVTIIGSQTARTRASLHVVDPDSYAFKVLEYPGLPTATPLCMVHDAERDTLLVGMVFNSQGTLSSRLVRYSLPDGAVAADVSIPDLGSCNLTTDGQRLLTGSIETVNGSQSLFVSELDPVTLERKLQTREPQQLTLQARGMASANNGKTIIVTELASGPMQSYSQLRPELRRFDFPGSTFSAEIAGSSDGSTVLASTGGIGIVEYDSDTDQMVGTPLLNSATSLGLNRTGDRVLLSYSQVYDADSQLLSSLPASTLAAALAPITRRAYALDDDGSVRIFDVSSAAVGTFPEILPAITLSEGPGTQGLYRIQVSHDERALFIAGTEQVVVVPLP